MNMNPENHFNADELDTLTEFRGNQWQQAINAELQDLITAASQIRAEISNAKTGTKKKYFEKKFAKIQKQVFQSLIAKQRIDSRIAADTTTKDILLPPVEVDIGEPNLTFS